MPKVYGDRIKVGTSTSGTGTVTLGSAFDGFQDFASGGISDGDTVRYVIIDDTDWEIGSGTYTSTGTTLSRTLSSSSTGSLLDLSGAGVEVFVSVAADDLVYEDGGTFSGSVTFSAGMAFTNWTVTESGGALYFATGGVNKMKLDASGNLDIAGSLNTDATIT